MSHTNKKAAIELSIGTVVIIVIAMSMLILGLVLVRNIFTGATQSVNILDDKVQNEIKNLFNDENQDVVVKLGSDKTAKVRPGSDPTLVAIAARVPDGSRIDNPSRLQYRLSLDTATTDSNCLNALGTRNTESLFVTSLDRDIPFDEIDGPNAFAAIEIKVPKGTAICSQKVLVKVYDKENNNQLIGQRFFRIEILREGLF